MLYYLLDCGINATINKIDRNEYEVNNFFEPYLNHQRFIHIEIDTNLRGCFMSKLGAITDIYKSTIEENLGLVVKTDSDGDLLFKHPALGTLYISFDAIKDPEFMMLTYPAFVDANRGGLDKDQLSYICNKINTRCKGVKLIIADNDASDVHAVLQMLVAMPGEYPTKEFLTAVLNRGFTMITNSVSNFATDAKQLLAGSLEANVEIHLH